MAQNDFLSFLADPKERGAMLQTVMQSLNRGIVANALGGTVDMGNALANLGRAGVGYVGHKTGLLSADQMPEIVDVPTGGSEWFGEQMRRTGMVSGERNQLAEGFAGLLGMAGGKGIEKAAPEIARGLLAVGENAMAPRTITGSAAGQRGMILYHGTEAKDRLKAIEDGGGMFGGLFSSGQEGAAGSHGQFVYRMTVPDEKILRHGDDIGDAAYSVVKKRLGDYLPEKDLQTVARLVDLDKSGMQDIPDHLVNALSAGLPGSTGNGMADASWHLQRLRGEAAKKAGFDAVAMLDEHGTSYLVNNATPRPYNQSAKSLARGLWEPPQIPAHSAPKPFVRNQKAITIDQWRALPESEKAANVGNVTAGDRRALKELAQYGGR